MACARTGAPAGRGARRLRHSRRGKFGVALAFPAARSRPSLPEQRNDRGQTLRPEGFRGTRGHARRKPVAALRRQGRHKSEKVCFGPAASGSRGRLSCRRNSSPMAESSVLPRLFPRPEVGPPCLDSAAAVLLSPEKRSRSGGSGPFRRRRSGTERSSRSMVTSLSPGRPGHDP